MLHTASSLNLHHHAPTLSCVMHAARYMCRGNIHVRIRGLTAMLATNSISPHVKPHEPRLVLTAATLSAGMVGGLVDVASTHMSAIAYGMGPDTGPGKRCWKLLALRSFCCCICAAVTPR